MFIEILQIVLLLSVKGASSNYAQGDVRLWQAEETVHGIVTSGNVSLTYECRTSLTLDRRVRQPCGRSSASVSTENPVSSQNTRGNTNFGLDNLGCSGRESTLAQCSRNSWGSHNCGAGEGVRVGCSNQFKREGHIVRTTYQGLLQVFYANQWAMVCDDDFDIRDARVVCRQLNGVLHDMAWLDAGPNGGTSYRFWSRKCRTGSESHNTCSLTSATTGTYTCGPAVCHVLRRCLPGHYGGSCNKGCGYCAGGSCDEQSGLCPPGGCMAGYRGPKCDTACGSGKWGLNCNETCGRCSGRSCDHVNGRCRSGSCQPGYMGWKCDKGCTDGFYGANCRNVCGHCDGGRCSPTDGGCVEGCRAGYAGQRCDTVCEDGFWGLNCSQSCGKCSNESCDHVDGRCLVGCQAGYMGRKCDSACFPGFHGVDCRRICGHCGNGVCSPTDGFCGGEGCDPGYHGVMCDTVCQDGFWGLNCSKNCGKCSNGSCDHVDGGCFSGNCKPGYMGRNCDSACSPSFHGADCRSVCGHCGNGVCSPTDGSCGGEGCEPGYHGVMCDKECAPGRWGEQCDNNCGMCVNQSCHHVDGRCISGRCTPGYTGIRCDSDDTGINDPPKQMLTGSVRHGDQGSQKYVAITSVCFFAFAVIVAVIVFVLKKEPRNLFRNYAQVVPERIRTTVTRLVNGKS